MCIGTMKDLIREGLEEDAVVEGKRDKKLSKIVDEIQETLPKTEAEIEETQVEQADRDLEAETKLSKELRTKIMKVAEENGIGITTSSSIRIDFIVCTACAGVQSSRWRSIELINLIDLVKRAL